MPLTRELTVQGTVTRDIGTQGTGPRGTGPALTGPAVSFSLSNLFLSTLFCPRSVRGDTDVPSRHRRCRQEPRSGGPSKVPWPSCGPTTCPHRSFGVVGQGAASCRL